MRRLIGMKRYAGMALVVGMLFFSLTTVGCLTNSAQQGAVGGAAAGALAGQIIGRDTTSTLIGTGIGMGLGYIIGNEMDKKKAQQK